MDTGILIILISGGAWLAFVVGVYVAIYRHVRRRGRIIMGSGAALVALLIVALVSILALRNVAAVSSPSNATLVMVTSDDTGKLIVNGVSGHDGAIHWQRPVDLAQPSGIVADGVVYLTGNAASDDTHPTVEALRLGDGAALWRLTLPGMTQAMPGISLSMSVVSSPGAAPRESVADGMLITIVATSLLPLTTQVVAVNLSTHALAWRADMPAPPMNRGFAALATGAGLVFLGSRDGVVRALRLSDGRLAWSMRITPASAGTQPMLSLGVASRGARLIVYDATGEVVSLRQSDGATLWGRRAEVLPYFSEQVTLTGAGLYVCGDLAATQTYALLSLDPATGATRWSRPAACGVSPPVAVGDYLYTLDYSTLTVLRANDGSLLWHNLPEERDLGYRSLQSDGSVIFVTTSVANFRSLTLCGDWWRRDLIFCHSAQYLAAFNSATGTRYWRTSDPGSNGYADNFGLLPNSDNTR